MSWQEDIERYLEHKMSHADRKLFEERLESDESLKREYDLYVDAKTLLDVAGYIQQKERIRKLDSSPSNVGFKQLTMAASLIIGLALAGWWAFQMGNTSDEFDMYFDPYPDRISVLGEHDMDIDQAMALYNAGQHAEAIAAFEQIDASEDSLGLISLYTAVSYLAIDSCERSAEMLGPITERGSSLSEAATWYTVLSLYKCHHTEEAIALLSAYLQQDRAVFNASRGEALLRHLKEE